MKRREFIINSAIASAALSIPGFTSCNRISPDERLLLMRYDTEWWGEASEMEGFFEKVIEVHSQNEIPATFFCRGFSLVNLKQQFSDFYEQVKSNPLFDFQDHSFEHIGLCKKEGQGLSFDDLKADYTKSFAAHKEVFGKDPIGVSMCGTKGESYSSFDENDKTKAEFEMLANLGVKMINSYLKGVDSSREFCNFKVLDHPEIMGFPSSNSDTDWGLRNKDTKGVEYIHSDMQAKANANEHMSVMYHDWVAWQHADDKELTHVKRIADKARELNYRMVTHLECYHAEQIWRS